jgi:hypothetical protein
MQQISKSELRRMQAEIAKLQSKYTTVAQRLGFRPHPIEFAETVLGSKLDWWQCKFMNDAMENPRLAIAACRQSGKSTVAGLFVAWCLIFIPDFMCLVASRSLRQASHFLTLVRSTVLSFIPKEAMKQVNRLSLELPNGSMVISVPCSTPDAGRGFSPYLVVLDEAAFAPEALFRALSPSLAATHGAMVMISSPNGRQGQFFEAFHGTATSIYRTQSVSWQDCPRIEPEFIAAERIALGPLYFAQEYESQFITPQGAFFGFSALSQFEDGEDADLSGLELREIENWMDDKHPLPDPSLEDMSAALDRTARVSRLLYGS